MMLIAVMAVGAKAQTVNKLIVPDVTVQIGQAELPVAIENTDELVAVQFDLVLPEGFSANYEGRLSNRSDGHKVTIGYMGDYYRVMVHSSSNSAILGQSGTLLYLPIVVPDDVEEGEEYPLTLRNMVLTKLSGENVLTETSVGKLTISKLPDLTVKSITADKTTLTPGENVVISWQVENVGGLSTTGGWSEQVSLVSEDGSTSKLIATTYYDEALESSGIVSRQVEITLPTLLGIEGNASLQVKVVPTKDTGESTSAQGNNTATTDALYNINKVLTLTLSPNKVGESSYSRVTAKLSRSGQWEEAETFTITTTEDSRITIPQTVTIPAGQSGSVFYVRLSDNDVLDDNSTINISIAGNGYEAVEQQLEIEDNEYPNLTLTASKSVLTEGETFELTVTTSRASTQPITVTLSSENAKRFSFPQTVTIPAGETSATVEVTATDDEVPSLDLSNAFTASAPSHNKGEVIVLLKDNDLPVLELQLTPNTVSEGAGPVSVVGVLRRTTNTNTKITVKLTDDADGGLYFGNRTLTLNKGVNEVHFNFGPIDNALVDGDRTYTITAAVWLSSCSCSVLGEQAGVITAQLNVLDDDGLALGLASSLSTVKEGGSTTLTVSRNTTDNSTPLTVTLISDYENGLTYNHTITIPAGQQLTTVDVTSAANGVQGDSHTVVFTVQAEGYSTGTCYLLVTDQTLPDLTVKSIAVSPATIMVNDNYTVDVTLSNTGVADVPARSTFTVTVAGMPITMTIADPISPMQEKTVTLNLTAPSVPGSYSVEVEGNPSYSFPELQMHNNSLNVPLTVASTFDVTVVTDRANYLIGETVKIIGQIAALKGAAAGVSIEPYIVCYGMRQVLSATTDAEGRFIAEYTLPAGMGGDFAVGACMPGENATTAMTTIHVYGMARTTASYLKGYLTVGKPQTLRVPIKNLSSLPLHNIKATVTDNADHYDVTSDGLALLDGNSEGTIELTIRSDEASTSGSWEQVRMMLTSDEGTSLDLLAYCYTNIELARLTLEQSVINTNISSSKPTVIPVTLVNTGLGETGRITVMVPQGQTFFSLTTPAELPSMALGDSTIIGLCFNPAGLDINVVQRGSIAINCEHGDGTLINYNLKVVSEEIGNLKVLVEDENTIYGNAAGEHPYVSGATVTLKDYSTGRDLYTAITAEEGSVLFNNVPEGYYTLYVTASKHTSYIQNVLVSPGLTNEHLATISYQPVSISWTVEETTTEDQYEIVTELSYETQVPVPVIEVITPDTLDLYNVEEGQQLLYHIVVTNKGLIAAQNVRVDLPEAEGFVFTPLDTYAGFELRPQQSHTIPVLVTRDDNPSASRRRSSGDDIKYVCGKDMYINWQWVCKNHRDAWWVKTVYFLMRNCKPTGVKDVPPVNVEEDWPMPDNGPEPKLKYYNIEPVDLETIKEIVSTIACMMVCALPEKLTVKWVKEPKFRWKCAWQEATNRHPYPNGSRRAGNSPSSSLRDSYLDRLYHFIKLSEAVYEYYEELANSPQLSDDDETFNRLMPSIDEIIELMRQQHDEGTLYTTSIDDLCGMAVALLPQQTTDWYDFNLRTFIERLLNTFRLRDGQTVTNDNHCNVTKLNEAAATMELWQQRIRDLGYADYKEMIESMNTDVNALNAEQSNVCAKVKLQLSQEMAFTRQAFLGTLVIENSTDGELTDISALITATDENGVLATSHEMEIVLEKVEGFKTATDGSYMLGAGEEGTFTYKFIPTKYAAPNHAVNYGFGGTLTFNDGSGITKRDLYPVTLTVKPSPELDLTYFMQRDVYGDDPLTLDVVEPMKPAEFALLINNKGNGDATNVRMVTQQPEIIENEKGLKIDFELISSQVNGGDAALSFGKSIANDFGTIPAHSQTYAQWWLTSTLLGHFTDYKVEANHVTSYGNEDLSLLDQVTIHELIHGFDMATDEHGMTQRAFLVNDIADAEDLPDKLYFTNGETDDVAIATTATVERTSPTSCLLTITPSNTGWNYGSLLDPTHGYAELKSIVRQSDGQELGNTRFWQTDRTLRDGKDWLYENRLHFVDEFESASPVTYVLTFDPVPSTILEVVSIATVPEEGTVAEEPIETLTVTFNKEIDASTFTGDDITFAVQGVKQDASQIGISTEDNKSFTLDLATLTEQCPNGYYTMTVQTADITDNEGFQGRTGKQVGWIMFRGGLVQLLTSAWPENSGTVTRRNDKAGARGLAPGDEEENSAQYGSTVTFVAEPATGYEFTNWTLNGEVVSTDAEFTTTALGDMNVVANFTKKSYMVNVHVNGTGGTATGTQISKYGEVINVKAIPDEDYALKGWTVNGEAAEGSGNELTVTVDKTLDIEASFLQEYFRQSMTLARGWNWISAYLSEPLAVADLGRYVNRIVSQEEELINDPEYGLVGNITELQAGKAYKIQANSRFTNSFRGHLYDVEAVPFSLHKGWNWVAYPNKKQIALSAFITNADEGDYIASQMGFAEYADGSWAGTLDMLTPGEGYLYKSATEKTLAFDFTATVNGSRSWKARTATVTEQDIDIHRYPNTMNVTARIYRDGVELAGDDYTVYAMVGDEVRGISQCVSGSHYLTVYGDVPVDVTFLVESAGTGETFVADETLKFRCDVVGSRKAPFAINISGATGIDSFDSSSTMTVHTLEGVLISRDATLKTLRRLPKGVYIVNGQKYLVK